MLLFCPDGWGITQLAAYHKNPQLLELFLKLNVDFRTLKKQGGVTFENNALHIAIGMGYLDGVRILLNSHLTKKTKSKGHFIDEKNRKKQTPWALAIYLALTELKNYDILRLLANKRPSSEVEVIHPTIGRLMDGRDLAIRTRNPEIINIAEKFMAFRKL